MKKNFKFLEGKVTDCINPPSISGAGKTHTLNAQIFNLSNKPLSVIKLEKQDPKGVKVR